MTEYRIEIPSKLSTVKKIWKQFLKDDDTWHFTLEGDYIELRIDIDHKSALWVHKFDQFLSKNKWKYTTFPYQDNIQITRKYQKQFEEIFHGYSELAMILPRKTWEENYNLKSDFSKIIERCIHLNYNINGVSVMDEASHLAQILVMRSYTGGWYAAQNQQSGEKENGGKS